MILKAVSLFLVFMMVLGMFGKWKFPTVTQLKTKVLPAKKCRKCGNIKTAFSKCSCGSSSDGT